MKTDNLWLKELINYGITKKDYESTNKLLNKKFGKEANQNDVIWALFNRALINNINNLSVQSNIYYCMGTFVRNEEGKDPNQYFRLSTISLLNKYKSLGFTKVTFIASLGSRTCINCSKLNGKIFEIDKVIKDPPVPNKKCKSKDDYNHLLCRCAITALDNSLK